MLKFCSHMPAVLALALLAGCVSSDDQNFGRAAVQRAPAIVSSELPPPVDLSNLRRQNTQQKTSDPSAMRSIDRDTALPISSEDLLGGWTVTTTSERCQLYFSLTPWEGGYRANSRGCIIPALTDVVAWQIAGRQLILLGRQSLRKATIYSVMPGRFVGDLQSGERIQIFR